MSESGSPTTQSEVGHDDPDRPWNRQYTAEEFADWNSAVITEFRANAGKVGGDYAGSELILLTTTGAKSGKPHIVPLGVLRRDGAVYLSSFIEGKYPAWVHNARANPQVSVEIGTERRTGHARVLAGAEYDEFAAWVREHNPPLAEYQSKISRPVPLVVLTLDEPN